MFNKQDLQQLENKIISPKIVNEQLLSFVQGFPFLQLAGSASVNRGISAFTQEQQNEYIDEWSNYLDQNKKIVKFVPASGAASRMFKELFEFLSAPYSYPTSEFEKTFFDNLQNFAFYLTLDETCKKNENKSIKELITLGEYKAIVSNLLNENGLNYGSLPKGLLQFHSYDTFVRTAMEEHLAEGERYAKSNNGEVNIHFTVSPEHLPLFKKLVLAKKEEYERSLGVKYIITFSVQKSSTDTIAVDPGNNIFRDNDGNMVFRPGGHGALIQNLNDIDADIVFVKNIDNVVPDNYKPATIVGKKLIGGVLVSLQKRTFRYLATLEGGNYTKELLNEIICFFQEELSTSHFNITNLKDKEMASYLIAKLRRPLRVCGMVKNVGEAGGGPFFTTNSDGTVSLQILESSQIDLSNAASKTIFENGTHFNPVDLVCALKDNLGNKYDLPKFVDPLTGFISSKSKDGKSLKALELPGLWNGAMSDWNTIFVEVPIETFNPVKSVNDLLRTEHQ